MVPRVPFNVVSFSGIETYINPLNSKNGLMSRRDYDYNFGMSDGDWGMGYGSKNKAEYVKAPQETR